MNKLSIAFLASALFLLSFANAQTNIFTVGGGGTLPTGWSSTNNITSEPIDKTSYYMVQPGSPGDYITTTSYDLCTYTSATLSVDIGSFGSGTHRALLVEVSLDGGTTYTQSYTTNVTTSSTETTISPLITISPLSDDVVIRFSVDATSGRGIRMQNIDLEASGSTTCPTACTFPTTQASSGSVSSIGVSDATINWTRGNGDNVLVVLQAGSAAGTPASGTAYTANASFGSGDAIGSGFVVYNGTGTSVTVSNLTDGTTYHYAIYEYSNTATCYNTTGLTGNFTTVAIGTLSDIIAAGGESATVPSTEITAGPLTSTQGVQVWEFTVRDGGASGDADALPTILDDLIITQSAGNAMNDWDVAIQSADVFDGTTHLGTGVITATQISFTGLNVTTLDDATKTLTLRISLNCPANNSNNLDGDDFGFRISQSNVTEAGSGTSMFDSFTQINSTNGQNVYDIIQTTITSITPTSGPVGTTITINATGGGFTGATAVTVGGVAVSSFTVESDNVITAVTASGTTSGTVDVTDAFCYTDSYTGFTVIDGDNSTCEGRATYSDLFISEVYDASSGDTYYYEIYNGTGAAVTLTGVYAIGQDNNGGGVDFTTNLTGTIPDGGTFTIGNNDVSCPGARDQAGHGSGINGNDGIYLIKSGVQIDRWGDPGTTIHAAGVTYIRKASPVNTPPTLTWDEAGDWDEYGTEICDSLGTHNVPGGDAPTITAQPTTSTICAGADATISTTATEGFAGGNALEYQWYEQAPGSSTWTALSNGGAISGATSATLTISPADGYNDYQFYCEVKENTSTCYTATNSVQLDVHGDGGVAGLWEGNTSTDWCDCLNWDDGRVPTSTTAVTINQSASNNCEVTTGCAALALSMTVSSNSGVNNLLTISGTGSLSVTNAFNISKTGGTGTLIVETTGTGSVSASSLSITGTSANNAVFRNESATTSVDINGDVTINSNGLLDLNANGTINVAEDFIDFNSNGFDESNSSVIFDGAGNQDINTSGFTEVFHDITLSKSGGVVTLQDPIEIDNSGIVALGDDQIDLNGFEMTVLNNSTTSFTRTSGSVIDESGAAAGANSGKLTWAINTNAASYIYPFADGVAGTYIPFTYELTAGDAGEVSVSTYGTGTDNLPWPSSPDVVMNLNSVAGLTPDNRSATVDRFWQIDVQNAPTATMTFSYPTSELPGAPYNASGSMQAQRYDVVSNTWNYILYPGQTTGTITGGFTVTVPNITTFSPWAIAHIDSPLPVELRSFEAEKVEDQKGLLKWVTASELNCNFFEVQRSGDGEQFETIGMVQAAGNSSSDIHYEWIDDQPLNGNNYYRLKTIDFDGYEETSDTRKLYFSNVFSVYQNDMVWVLEGKNVDAYNFELYNSLGQKISLREIISFGDDLIKVSNTNMIPGTYLIVLRKNGVVQSYKLIKG